MNRLIPAYLERPAWALYDAVVNGEDLERLADLADDLRAALLRGDAILYAPTYVLAQLGE